MFFKISIEQQIRGQPQVLSEGGANHDKVLEVIA